MDTIISLETKRQGRTQKYVGVNISIDIGMKGTSTYGKTGNMTLEELDSIILPIIEPYDKRIQLENMIAVKVCCPFCDKVQYVDECKLFKEVPCSCGKEIEPIFDMIE